MRWQHEFEDMSPGRWALLAVPAVFVTGAVLGLAVVGGMAGHVTTTSFYLATVAVATALLVTLALPVYPFGRPRRLESLGWAALLVGFGQLSLIAFAPMAYGPGPTRTDWIEGTALWMGSLSILCSLAVIGVGAFLAARSSSGVRPRYRLARAWVLAGAALGATAYHLALLAITYDLQV